MNDLIVIALCVAFLLTVFVLTYIAVTGMDYIKQIKTMVRPFEIRFEIKFRRKGRIL